VLRDFCPNGKSLKYFFKIGVATKEGSMEKKAVRIGKRRGRSEPATPEPDSPCVKHRDAQRYKRAVSAEIQKNSTKHSPRGRVDDTFRSIYCLASRQYRLDSIDN